MSSEHDRNGPPAGASSLTTDKGYKWIVCGIERLDPEVDYARIWALSTTYYADDTLVNLLYALGMPCFTQNPHGRELSEYVIGQFNEARLPKFLWGVGRQLVLTFQDKHIRQLHRMGDPNPMAAWLIKLGLKTKILFQERVLPDPKMNAAERARARGEVEDQLSKRGGATLPGSIVSNFCCVFSRR